MVKNLVLGDLSEIACDDASDLIRIMVAFGNCDAKDLLRRIVLRCPNSRAQVRTVEAVLQEMRDDECQ